MTDYPTHSSKFGRLIPQSSIHRIFHIKTIFSSIWPYRMVRVILATIFLWSGLTKLFNPASFAVIIETYGLIPASWVMPVAIVLPALEVVAAVGLLMDIRGSLSIISGLLVFFAAILMYGIWLGLDIDCGCFGPEDPEGKAFHSLRLALYRDFAMMAGVIYLCLWRYYRSVTPVRLRTFIKNFFEKGGLIDASD